MTIGFSLADSNQLVYAMCSGNAPVLSQARAAAYSDRPPFTKDTDFSEDCRKEPGMDLKLVILQDFGHHIQYVIKHITSLQCQKRKCKIWLKNRKYPI